MSIETRIAKLEQIVAKSKETSELPLYTGELSSLFKIPVRNPSTGKLEQVTYDKFSVGGVLGNNRIFKQKIAYQAEGGSNIQQLATWLNNTNLRSASDVYDTNLGSIDFAVKASDIFFFTLEKVTTSGVESIVYGFRQGKGSYGVNGTDTVYQNDFEYLFSTITDVSDSDINETIDLGEIGTTDIWEAVNSAGAFTLEQGTVYIFRALRDEEPVDYYYIGQQGISVGGENGYPTNENDFIDLTNTEPVEPDLSSYVTFSDLDNSLYDTAKYYMTDVIANANITGNELFVLIETDTKYYFGSKTDNVEDFKNCRLFLRQGFFKYDFPENPTLVQNGYNFYDLGVNASQANLTPNDNNVAFTFWRKVGGEGKVKEKKVISQTTQYTLLPEDFTDYFLVFTANAGQQINIVVNENVCHDLNSECAIYSTYNNSLNFVNGNGVTLNPTQGNLLKSVPGEDGKGYAVAIKPISNVNNLLVYGTLVYEMDAEAPLTEQRWIDQGDGLEKIVTLVNGTWSITTA